MQSEGPFADLQWSTERTLVGKQWLITSLIVRCITGYLSYISSCTHYNVTKKNFKFVYSSCMILKITNNLAIFLNIHLLINHICKALYQ